MLEETSAEQNELKTPGVEINETVDVNFEAFFRTILDMWTETTGWPVTVVTGGQDADGEAVIVKSLSSSRSPFTGRYNAKLELLFKDCLEQAIEHSRRYPNLPEENHNRLPDANVLPYGSPSDGASGAYEENAVEGAMLDLSVPEALADSCQLAIEDLLVEAWRRSIPLTMQLCVDQYTQLDTLFEADRDLRAWWGALVKWWIYFEVLYQPTSHELNQRYLPSTNRPRCLDNWIHRGYPASYHPRIDLQTFPNAFWVWWSYLQPSWRTRDENGIILRDDDGWAFPYIGQDWSSMAYPGQHGILKVIAALYFWTGAINMVPNHDNYLEFKREWMTAMFDVIFVLKELCVIGI